MAQLVSVAVPKFARPPPLPSNPVVFPLTVQLDERGRAA